MADRLGARRFRYIHTTASTQNITYLHYVGSANSTSPIKKGLVVAEELAASLAARQLSGQQQQPLGRKRSASGTVAIKDNKRRGTAGRIEKPGISDLTVGARASERS